MRSETEHSNYRVNVDSREICTGISNGSFAMQFRCRIALPVLFPVLNGTRTHSRVLLLTHEIGPTATKSSTVVPNLYPHETGTHKRIIAMNL